MNKLTLKGPKALQMLKAATKAEKLCRKDSLPDGEFTIYWESDRAPSDLMAEIEKRIAPPPRKKRTTAEKKDTEELEKVEVADDAIHRTE